MTGVGAPAGKVQPDAHLVSGDASGHEGGKDRWRAVNAPHLAALVRAGARFEPGVLIERPEIIAA